MQMCFGKKGRKPTYVKENYAATIITTNGTTAH